jgi:hypothetical protein
MSLFLIFLLKYNFSFGGIISVTYVYGCRAEKQNESLVVAHWHLNYVDHWLDWAKKKTWLELIKDEPLLNFSFGKICVELEDGMKARYGTLI